MDHLLARHAALRSARAFERGNISPRCSGPTLILAQALPEVSANRIFGEVLRIRPQAWPNLRMLEFGDAMLGRRGELVAAAAGVYRLQLVQRQHLVEQMQAGGRGREIIVALGQEEGRGSDFLRAVQPTR